MLHEYIQAIFNKSLEIVLCGPSSKAIKNTGLCISLYTQMLSLFQKKNSLKAKF